MANANIYINEKAPDKKGACKLMLFFSYKGKRLMLYTGERCLPEHFDKGKMRVNRKHPFQIETNSILNNLCESTESHYKQFISKGKIPSVQELKEAIKPKSEEETSSSKHSMSDYFDLNERHQISKGNARSTKYNYRTLQRMFSKYEKDKKERIELHSFDEIQHTKFINWCIYELDNIPNTVAKRNGFIKSFFGFCERNGATVHPFYKDIKVKKINPEMIFLTELELKKMEEVEVDSYLEKTKDCFLFSCYTGLRYSDLKALTLDHISLKDEHYIINIFQEKTKKRISIVLSSKAVAIMEKYKNNVLRSQKNKYFLPIISNQKLNAYLKELGQIAEIDSPVEKITYHKGDIAMVMVPKYELLTFHKSRHTFATLSLQRGMPLAALQKILGHKRIEETMIYAKVVESFQHDQLLKAWDGSESEKEVIEHIKEPTEEDDNIEFEKIKAALINSFESKDKILNVEQKLTKNTIEKLSKLGFLVKETSPIQKIRDNLYHIISWE